MAKGYVGIPTSYTPVEYIESTGTQYIDTGFIPTANTKVDFDANIISGNSNAWLPVYGARSYTTSNYVVATYLCLYVHSDTHYLSPNYAGFDPGTSGNTTINFNQRYLLTQDRGQFYIDGVLKPGISTTNTITTGDKTMYLFTNNSAGETQLRGQDVKLYGCKIYENDVLVRDFIPVLDQDNVTCLYEQVERKFYYNKGTGLFTAGSTTGQSVSIGGRARKIAKAYVGVRQSYTPVEYIESSGIQYIDTKFKHNQNTRMVAKFEVDDYRAWAFLFGSYGGANAYPRKLLGVDVNNSGKFGSYYGYSYESFNINALGIHEFDFNKNIHTIDNETKTYPTQTLQSQFNDLIFGATNYTGGISISTDSLKLYYFKIYDNDVLVRDFIPVVDGNNVACLYEQVEGKFYYNKGTGTFTAGSTTGQTVSLGSKARRIIKGYVGVGGVARQVFT